MKISQWIMNKVAPACERTRMYYRMSVAMAHAQAEDLTRTVSLNGDQIRAAIERFRNADPEATLPHGS